MNQFSKAPSSGAIFGKLALEINACVPILHDRSPRADVSTNGTLTEVQLRLPASTVTHFTFKTTLGHTKCFDVLLAGS